MNETQQTKKWYDNTLVVVILCIIFFPVGLYALWKNNNFQKNTKIIWTVVIGIIVVIANMQNPKKDTTASADKPLTTADTTTTADLKVDSAAMPHDTVIESTQTSKEEEQPTLPVQEQIANIKFQAYKKYVEDEPAIDRKSPTVESFKKESKVVTEDILKQINYKIENWTAEVMSVDMFQDVECDLTLTIHPETLAGSKTVSGTTTFDCGFSMIAEQAYSKKYKLKGIKRSGELYKKVKSLSEGDKVIFSGSILNFRETTPATGIGFELSFIMDLTDINKQ